MLPKAVIWNLHFDRFLVVRHLISGFEPVVILVRAQPLFQGL